MSAALAVLLAAAAVAIALLSLVAAGAVLFRVMRGVLAPPPPGPTHPALGPPAPRLPEPRRAPRINRFGELEE